MSETLTRSEKKNLRDFEKKLGYRFRSKSLLKTALSHRSYAHELQLKSTAHNERLEYLGDAVLELAVSHLLMNHYPDCSEGMLSKFRASIVNEKTLASVARLHGLGDFLYLGRGEERCAGREKNSLLANAFEAVLGAIYLDRGFKKAFKVVESFAEELFKQIGTEGFFRDYKTQFQEKAQNLFKTTPQYKLIRQTGPDHDKIFEVSLLVRHIVMGQGQGKNKKEAEQDAARAALLLLEDPQKIAEWREQLCEAPS